MDDDEYWFVLGKGKSQKRYVESFEAAKRDLGIDTLISRVNAFEGQISTLLRLVPKESFEQLILRKLGYAAHRRSDLINSPFRWEKRSALERLVEENKVVQTRNGWYKLPLEA